MEFVRNALIIIGVFSMLALLALVVTNMVIARAFSDIVDVLKEIQSLIYDTKHVLIDIRELKRDARRNVK